MNICQDAYLYLTINSIYTGAGGKPKIPKKFVRYPYTRHGFAAGLTYGRCFSSVLVHRHWINPGNGTETEH